MASLTWSQGKPLGNILFFITSQIFVTLFMLAQIVFHSDSNLFEVMCKS